MHGLESSYGNQIDFVYLDVDDPATAELKEALGYTKQPEIYLMDADGNVVMDWSGMVSEQELETNLVAQLP